MIFEASSGFYPYDVLLSKERLVLEIDGTTHFYEMTKHRLPKYELKDKLFKASGISYMSLDYHTYLDLETKEVKSEKLIADIRR